MTYRERAVFDKAILRDTHLQQRLLLDFRPPHNGRPSCLQPWQQMHGGGRGNQRGPGRPANRAAFEFRRCQD